MSTSTPSSTRAPWPFLRFARTVLWYTRLGPLVGRGQASPAVYQPPNMPSASDRSGRVVLVTGAAGGVGRRVVAALLNDGVSVRALVRNKEAALKAFRSAGVAENVLSSACEGARLQLVISDLYNLRPEMFAGVDAVVSATGTRIGPPGDTPDRAMYFQGIKFYQPTVLEDTPENVEFKGISALVDAAADAFSKTTTPSTPAPVPVWTFDAADAVASTWGPLDDVVMGGVSESAAKIEGGELVFSGTLSKQNSGGFASIRSVNAPNPLDLRAYDGLHVRVKGDGGRYKLIVRTEQKWDGVAYCASFDTVPDQYTEVRVAWGDFHPIFRGKSVPSAPTLDAGSVFAAQLMVSRFEYDGELNPRYKDGPFALRVSSIGAYKDSAQTTTPRTKLPNRFVHCSSSGVTRVLRRAEFREEDLPPAVRLNEQVGRVVEWKFAGEDAVRGKLAEFGYTIVRPTAMTVDKAVGTDSLELEQGDNITGQVTRDDIARLMVEAVFDGSFTNKTFEVRQGAGKSGGGGLHAQADGLAADSDAITRKFGPYPFVPS